MAHMYSTFKKIHPDRITWPGCLLSCGRASEPSQSSIWIQDLAHAGQRRQALYTQNWASSQAYSSKASVFFSQISTGRNVLPLA